MGRLVKQTVTEVVFMDHLSSEDDIRSLTLRIDCEGAGRFLVLTTEKANSEIYLNSPEELRLIYETAVTLWEQGDIYAPGDMANDQRGTDQPVQRTRLLQTQSLTSNVTDSYREQRDYLLRVMQNIAQHSSTAEQKACAAIKLIREADKGGACD